MVLFLLTPVPSYAPLLSVPPVYLPSFLFHCLPPALLSSPEWVCKGRAGGGACQGFGLALDTQWQPIQYSCLENRMDGGAWWAAVHGVATSRTRMSICSFTFHFSHIEEENGNPLQYSCLENPRDRGAWWAAVYGVTQSRTRLKRLQQDTQSALPPPSPALHLSEWAHPGSSFIWAGVQPPAMGCQVR